MGRGDRRGLDAQARRHHQRRRVRARPDGSRRRGYGAERQPRHRRFPPRPHPPRSAVPRADPSTTDVTPPVTVASGADGDWHRTAVTVHLTATDAESLVAATYYKVDCGAWTRATRSSSRRPRTTAATASTRSPSTPSTTPPDSNTEPPKSVTVKIDTTPPGFTWRGVSPALITSDAVGGLQVHGARGDRPGAHHRHHDRPVRIPRFGARRRHARPRGAAGDRGAAALQPAKHSRPASTGSGSPSRTPPATSP